MTNWGTRKDGRHYPKTGRAVSGISSVGIDAQEEAWKKLQKEGLTLRHDLPIKPEDGEVKEEKKDSIMGDRKHKNQAKEVLKNESKMIKEIRDLEDKSKHKHLSGKQFDNLYTDLNNLDVVHPELHERVNPKVVPDEMTQRKTRQILSR